MKNNYKGFYSIESRQTYNRFGYDFTNLKVARRNMRAIANGECPKGSHGKWWVNQVDGIEVARGIV
jgi:nucleoside-triphosphatase THEP1